MSLSVLDETRCGVSNYQAPDGTFSYTRWSQVSGYFDGDGSIPIRFRRYHLKFCLSWTDSYLPRLQGLAAFLKAQGLSPTKPYRSDAVYFFSLNQQHDVLATAKIMIPLTCKKRTDLQTVVQYLENKITGNEAIERLNESVRVRRRSARIRHVNMPYTLLEGIREGRLFGTLRSARTQSKIKDDDKDTIRLERRAGVSVRELAARHGVSRDTIYHTLRAIRW